MLRASKTFEKDETFENNEMKHISMGILPLSRFLMQRLSAQIYFDSFVFCTFLAKAFRKIQHRKIARSNKLLVYIPKKERCQLSLLFVRLLVLITKQEEWKNEEKDVVTS